MFCHQRSFRVLLDRRLSLAAWDEATTENWSSRTWERVCDMKGSKPMRDSGGLQHEMDEQEKCAASYSLLTSIAPWWNGIQEKTGWQNLSKNCLRLGKTTLSKLKTWGKAGGNWGTWVASIWGHLAHQSTPSEQFGAQGAKVCWLCKMTQNIQPWMSLWKGVEGSCDQVTGLLKGWMKFKVAKWEIPHVVGDTALPLQASKPSFDIAQTSNKQAWNFCWPWSESWDSRGKKNRWFVTSAISSILVARLDTGLGAGHQVPNLT